MRLYLLVSLVALTGITAGCSKSPSFAEAARCAALSRLTLSMNGQSQAAGINKISINAFNYALSKTQMSREELEVLVVQMQLVDLPNEVRASGDATVYEKEVSHCYDSFH